MGQFTCSSDPLTCIPTSKRCDGIENDCENNSDETECEGKFIYGKRQLLFIFEYLFDDDRFDLMIHSNISKYRNRND